MASSPWLGTEPSTAPGAPVGGGRPAVSAPCAPPLGTAPGGAPPGGAVEDASSPPGKSGIQNESHCGLPKRYFRRCLRPRRNSGRFTSVLLLSIKRRNALRLKTLQTIYAPTLSLPDRFISCSCLIFSAATSFANWIFLRSCKIFPSRTGDNIRTRVSWVIAPARIRPIAS